MKTQSPKTPFTPCCEERLGQVRELDDALLRRGHALLDDSRNQDFSQWMDQQLESLETQFRSFMTRQSVRKSLGR